MKKHKLLYSVLATLSLIGITLGLSYENNNTANAGPNLNQGQLTVEHYEGRTEGVDAPLYITFDPDVNSPQLNHYGSVQRFYEQLYQGEFHWYSFVPPYDATASQRDMYLMMENRIDKWGGGSTWNEAFVNKNFSWNLKKGRMNPAGSQVKSQYMGDNSGTTLMTVNYGGVNAKGKKYEWRYLGYTPDGIPVENPYFPPDYPVATPDKWQPEDLSWVKQPWTKGYTTQTRYDGNSNKAKWFGDYFIPSNPSFRLPGKTDAQSGAYWADYFTLMTDPSKTTGIATGFHLRNGKLYYATFIMKTPPKPNLRIVEYTVTDKETGQVIAKHTRNPDKNADRLEAFQYPLTQNVAQAGKTYLITAKVKNMLVPGLAKHDTQTAPPLVLDQQYAWDEDSYTFGMWSKEYPNSVLPSSPTNIIPYNQFVSFDKDNVGTATWEYTIPKEVQKEIIMSVRIPEKYRTLDNIDNYDDEGRVRLKVVQEDIKCSCTAELVNSKGQVVDSVAPDNTYSLRFYVEKTKDMGTTKVGDKNNLSKNPFASVDVTVTDKGSITKTYKEVATKEVLDPVSGKTRVMIELKNAITPQTSMIEATWQISQKHRDNGQSSISTNDGPCKQLWASDLNLSVKDFVVKPQSIMIPTGQPAGSQSLTFQFTLMNVNADRSEKTVPVVIKRGGTILKSQNVTIPEGSPLKESWTVPSVPLAFGEIPFEVEVNPEPRKVKEFKRLESNPYLDNVARNAVHVYENPTPNVKCEIVHTRNDWVQTYELTYWTGYYEERERCDKDGNCTTYTVCVRDYWTEYQDVSHYETYEIEKVLFRSKLTTDTQGGWIDITKQPGKVKAGYGFEIKYIVHYKTNRKSAQPTAFGGCSYGRRVSPNYSEVTTPKQITVLMPYKDKGGNNVTYNLTPTSTSGSWDNITETYEMPLRNAFNMKSTREVYVNEQARDATYTIQIDSMPFYGSYDKPPVDQLLCDRKYVKIQILGADSDDLKTHITQ